MPRDDPGPEWGNLQLLAGNLDR